MYYLKHNISYNIINVLFFMSALFCWHSVSATEHNDTTLLMEYDASYKDLVHIINDNNLSDCLEGRSFMALTMRNSWFFYCTDKGKVAHLFYGTFSPSITKDSYISLEKFEKIFEVLKKNKEKIKRYYKESDCNPRYYLVFLDDKHIKIFEENNNTCFLGKFKRTHKKILSYIFQVIFNACTF